MKITALIDNVVYGKDLLAEHGLSLYIELDGKKILFDTGHLVLPGILLENNFKFTWKDAYNI